MIHMEDFSTPERYLYERAANMRVPIYGVLELSPLCNMNCDMCFVRLSGEELKEHGKLRLVEEWLNLAAQMKEAGVLFLLLTGGESLLYPGFRELYVKLKELGMILTVNTNGTMINEDWANFFAENPPRRINITLYGASEQMYSELCHYSGGFDKTINGIRLLRQRMIDVKLNGSLVRANENDRLKLIELGEQLDAPVVISTHMFPATRERQTRYDETVRLDPKAAAKAYVDIMKRELGKEFDHYCKQTLETFHTTEICEEKPFGMRCFAGKNSFIINWQGQMQSCIFMKTPCRSVFEVGFETAWKEIVEETDKIRLSATCGGCAYRKVCTICAAAAFTETGAYDAVPEYLCKYTKHIIRLLEEEQE